MATYGYPDLATRVVVITSTGTYPNLGGTGTTAIGVTSINALQQVVLVSGLGSTTVTTAGQAILISGNNAGNVVGPGSATLSGISAYADTTGKLLKSTSIQIDPSNNLIVPGSITGTSFLGSTVNGLTSLTSPLATITTINATNITGTNISGTAAHVATVYQSLLSTTGTVVNLGTATVNVITSQTAPITLGIPVTTAGKEFRVISSVSTATNGVTITGIGCNIDGSSTKALTTTATIGASAYMISDGINYYSFSSLV